MTSLQRTVIRRTFQKGHSSTKNISQQNKVSVERQRVRSSLKIYKINRSRRKQYKSTKKLFFNHERKKKYTYFLGTGNNEQLIKKVMQTRKSDWDQSQNISSTFVNFRWQQGNRCYKYHQLIKNNTYKTILNHFENHICLTNKQQMFRNIDSYCKKNKINIYEFIPPTFILNTNDQSCGTILNKFIDLYSQHCPQLKNKSELQIKKFVKQSRMRLKNYFYNNKEKRQFSKVTIDPNVFINHQRKCYLWILKPTSLNRGRGIEVFNDIGALQKIISKNIDGYVQKYVSSESTLTPTQNIVSTKQISKIQNLPEKNNSIKIRFNTKTNDPRNSNIYSRCSTSLQKLIKTNAFIIQKYLQNPFLINKRKFDLRVWVLITHDFKAYFFKQGYLRLSSQNYELNNLNVSNQFIHLTNNAIQKHSRNYSEFCQGNQLSFEWFQAYLKNQKSKIKIQQIIQTMKNVIKISLQAVQKKIDPQNRHFCFQIFGYDFILDKNGKPWLIQVNTNPCLALSSPLLKVIIPRMIDDAFRMTLDVLFPLTTKLGQSTFKVQNYSSSQNMWDYLYTLQKNR